MAIDVSQVSGSSVRAVSNKPIAGKVSAPNFKFKKSGEFKINGARISVRRGDNLESIVKKINKSRSSVKAELVKGKSGAQVIELRSRRASIKIDDRKSGIIGDLYQAGQIKRVDKNSRIDYLGKAEIDSSNYLNHLLNGKIKASLADAPSRNPELKAAAEAAAAEAAAAEAAAAEAAAAEAAAAEAAAAEAAAAEAAAAEAAAAEAAAAEAAAAEAAAAEAAAAEAAAAEAAAAEAAAAEAAAAEAAAAEAAAAEAAAAEAAAAEAAAAEAAAAEAAAAEAAAAEAAAAEAAAAEAAAAEAAAAEAQALAQQQAQAQAQHNALVQQALAQQQVALYNAQQQAQAVALYNQQVATCESIAKYAVEKVLGDHGLNKTDPAFKQNLIDQITDTFLAKNFDIGFLTAKGVQFVDKLAAQMYDFRGFWASFMNNSLEIEQKDIDKIITWINSH